MAKQNFWRLLTVVACLLAFPMLSRAQNSADIVGTVTDSTGAAVANAKITLKNLGTSASRTMQTGTSGDYAFTLLPVGAYSVTVEVGGFKTFTASITVAAGDRARVDAKMEVGAVEQTVEVQSTAPLLQTDSSTVGGLLTDTAVQDLPVNGRNAIRLVQLAPGASEGPQSTLSGGNRPDDRRQTSTVVANGQNDSSNNYMLDGLDNNERAIATVIVKPSVDALQEVKVETNMYSADTGRVGGAVISMVTKSGTNRFHGTAFEFLRNDKFDAKDYFNVPQPGNALAGVKPEYRQNQFGGSLGGPIRKDKTFFFADYEGLRIIQGLTQTAFTPTPCELGRVACNGVQQVGNFSDLKTQIYDPVTHAAYANNIIPAGALNPIGVNYAALYPTVTGCTVGPCPFVSSPNKTQYFHTGDLRIDERVGGSDNIFGRYTINNGDSYFPGALPIVQVAGLTVYPNGVNFNTTFPGFNYGRQQNLSLGWDHVFRSNLIMDLRASVTRYVSLSTADNAGNNVNAAFGGPGNINLPSIAGTGGLALLAFQNGGYSGLGDQFALPTDYWDTNYQYTGDVVWTKGPHTFKFGGSLLRRNWSIYQQLFKGRIQLNSTQTNSTGGNGGTGGNSFASLLTGTAIQENSTISLTSPQYRDWEIGAYAQDDWRATRWLTLNLGLRYDIFTPFTEKNNLISDFDPTNAAMLAGGQVEVAGQNGVPATLGVPAQKNMFQPRVGFAASLGHNVVLRGGFGTSYFVSNTASPAGLKNAPFNFAYSSAGSSVSLNTPFGFPTSNPNSVCLVASCGAKNNVSVGDAMALNFQNAMLYMYNLTLEKSFGNNDLSVGWVGEPGRNLGRVIPNIDVPAPLGSQSAACLASLKPGAKISLPNPVCQPYGAQLPFVNSIQLLESNGSSSFNAMNVIFQRRYSSGLTAQASYTWEHALANVGGPASNCITCGIIPTNPSYDWGNSDYNVKHRVAITANYELPFGKGLSGVEGQIVKGWAVNGIYSYATGVPFTVTEPTNAMGISGVTDRPDMGAASSGFHQSLSEWFDISQFTLPSFGTAGNEERNQLTAPASKRLDFSIFKDFPVKESVKLQFRAEAFNLTNTPNFASPGQIGTSNIGSFSGTTAGSVATAGSNFGKITQTSPLATPRQIQFALKFMF